MKTKTIIAAAILANILILLIGCAPTSTGALLQAPTPTGTLGFDSYLEHQKIPLTCDLIIPESSRNYRSTSMAVNFTVGPLFAENVPNALRQVIKDVSVSSKTSSDFIITANLNDFSMTLSGIFPVVNATVTYELCTNDRHLFKKLTTTQSYKSSFGSPSGPELYKMVFLECLENLNSQLLEQKDFIISKTTK